jgi:uncharacterized protein YqgV (UPF0045/DUF77 family)
MKLKIKRTDMHTMESVIEEKEFETVAKAIEYINEADFDMTIVRAYEVETGKRIVGGELK